MSRMASSSDACPIIRSHLISSIKRKRTVKPVDYRPHETGLEIVDIHQLKTEIKGDVTLHELIESDPSKHIRKLRRLYQWQKIKDIGEGGFGLVWLEQEQHGDCRAVKEIRKQVTEKEKNDYLSELIAMASLYLYKEQSNFPAFYGWFNHGSVVRIAMEYFPLGDLSKHLSRPVPEIQAKSIIYQIAEALDIIHSKGITHRDLKPQNVFIVQDGPDWWVKLGDFGISKRVTNNDTLLHTQYLGLFVAPEVNGTVYIDGEEDSDDIGIYSSKVDIWSLGCLTHWLLTLQTPFTAQRSLNRYCAGKGSLPTQYLEDAGVSTSGTNFIRRCLSVNFERRPSAAEAQDLSWLASLADTMTIDEADIDDAATVTASLSHTTSIAYTDNDDDDDNERRNFDDRYDKNHDDEQQDNKTQEKDKEDEEKHDDKILANEGNDDTHGQTIPAKPATKDEPGPKDEEEFMDLGGVDISSLGGMNDLGKLWRSDTFPAFPGSLHELEAEVPEAEDPDSQELWLDDSSKEAVEEDIKSPGNNLPEVLGSMRRLHIMSEEPFSESPASNKATRTGGRSQSLPTLPVSPRDVLAVVTALYAYKPQSSDGMQLESGDSIMVTEKGSAFWSGHNQRSGKYGSFPRNYVTTGPIRQNTEGAGEYSSDDKLSRRDPSYWWSSLKRRNPPGPSLLRTSSTESYTSEPKTPSVFGLSLDASLQLQKTAIYLIYSSGGKYLYYGFVPTVVAVCCIRLKESVMDLTGIIASLTWEAAMDSIQAKFEALENHGKDIQFRRYDIWKASLLLQRYLERLQEPVILDSFYERFATVFDDLPIGHGLHREDEIMRRLVSYTSQMPVANQQLLIYLLDLIDILRSKKPTSSLSDLNKFAEIFQRGILWRAASSPAANQKAQRIISVMVENKNWFFDMIKPSKGPEPITMDMIGRLALSKERIDQALLAKSNNHFIELYEVPPVPG